MSITPTWSEIISEAIESKLIDVHTAMPGVVQSYDNTTQTADIRLEIKRVLLDNDDQIVEEDLPVLPNVPIAFPRSADFFVSFPIASGDRVLIIFSESSIDKWRSKGSDCSPGDARRHSLTSGIAIPCLYPNSETLSDTSTSDMVIGHDSGSHIHIKTGGTVEVTSSGAATADDYVAMASKVKEVVDAIKNIFSSGAPVPNDGGAALQTAWSSAAAAISTTSMGSTNLKADKP